MRHLPAEYSAAFSQLLNVPMLPRKLRNDSIVEALCVVRFGSKTLPEIVVGRLVDCPQWEHFEKSPLPVSDIPAHIRRMGPDFRNEPLLQLTATDKMRIVRVGENVLSYHVLKPYPGWDVFKREVHTALDWLFSRIDSVVIESMGLRYVNALTREGQRITGIHDLALQMQIANDEVRDPFNVAVATEGDVCRVLTRIASPMFAKGRFPKDTTAVIDVDVTSHNDVQAQTATEAMTWFEQAHGQEKHHFFQLLPKQVLKTIIEE